MNPILFKIRTFLADIIVGDMSFAKNISVKGDITARSGQIGFYGIHVEGRVFSPLGELECARGKFRLKEQQ